MMKRKKKLFLLSSFFLLASFFFGTKAYSVSESITISFQLPQLNYEGVEWGKWFCSTDCISYDTVYQGTYYGSGEYINDFFSIYTGEKDYAIGINNTSDVDIPFTLMNNSGTTIADSSVYPFSEDKRRIILGVDTERTTIATGVYLQLFAHDDYYSSGKWKLQDSSGQAIVSGDLTGASNVGSIVTEDIGALAPGDYDIVVTNDTYLHDVIPYIVYDGDDSDANKLARRYVAAGSSNTYSFTFDDGSDDDAPIASNLSVTGTPNTGTTLSVSYTYSDTESDTESGTAFQWYRSTSDSAEGTAISGATGSTYMLTPSDLGSYIYVTVTAGAASGSTPGNSIKSSYIGVVRNADIASIIEEQILTAHTGASSDIGMNNYFGYSVSVSGDYAVVGAYYASGYNVRTGIAYVYEWNGSSWDPVTSIEASDAEPSDYFGYSVGISGTRIIVGAYGEDTGGQRAGAAYIFEKDEGGTDNWGEVKKITASDPNNTDYFGETVDISGDTVIIGAQYDDEISYNAGAAYIFEKDTGGADNWGEVKKITASNATGYDNFGKSVAISGTTAVVGAPAGNGNVNGSGAAYIFVKDQGGSNNWGELKVLSPSDGENTDFFGNSVSISDNTLLVGAPQNDTDAAGENSFAQSGSVYIYQRNTEVSDNWGYLQKLVATDREFDTQFGSSVVVSGNYAVVGAYTDWHQNGEKGSAYVIEFDGSSWSQKDKITASDAENGSEFGFAVGVSGKHAMVGSPKSTQSSTSNAGAAYYFQIDIPKLVAIPKVNGSGAVDITYRVDDDDNDELSVSLRYSPGSCTTYDGTQDTLTVGQIESATYGQDDIVLNNEQAEGYQLTAVTTTPGENELHIIWDSQADASSANNEPYCMYAFSYDGTTISDVSTTTVQLDNVPFGTPTLLSVQSSYYSIYLEWAAAAGVSNYAVSSTVPTITYTTNATSTTVTGFASSTSYALQIASLDGYGNLSAYSNIVTTTTKQAPQKVVASDRAAGDYFGYSVSISGEYAVVGAYGEDSGGSFAGAAYIFKKVDNEWQEVTPIYASDGAGGDHFGYSVSISGEYAVVGAYGEDTGGSSAGAAYIFSKDEGGTDNWGQVKKIVASDGAASDLFGQSVSISGEYAVVGAYRKDIGAGAAYIFSKDEGGTDNWGPVKKITANDPDIYDYFGWRVAVSGDTIIAGAPYDDELYSNAGAVYIFSKDEGGTDNWGPVKKITSSSTDRFGMSISIAGPYISVGAKYETVNGTASAGAAYIFSKDEGGTDNWGQQTRIVANDGDASDYFSISIGLSEHFVLVGSNSARNAFGKSDGNTNGGGAYLYARNNNSWDFVQKLVSPVRSAYDYFGTAIALDGEQYLISAYGDDEDEHEENIVGSAGSAYFFSDISIPENTAPTSIALSTSTILESVTSGTSIGIFSTADADGGSMSYALVAGSGDIDNADFAISGNTLFTSSTLDYESQSTSTIRVQVTDSGGLTYETSFVITIEDANDIAPVIDTAGFVLAEDATNSTSVGTLTASDADALSTTYANWTIVSGNEDSIFSIVSGGGNTAILSVLDQTNLDFEATQSYTLGITVSDGVNTSNQTNITITVTDVNDNAPVISSNGGGATASISIAENTTAVTTVTATDADVNDTVSYSITGGADQTAFSISGGALTFTSAPDHENPQDDGTNNTYVVIVTASDGTYSDTQTITVTITDINDNPPTISSNGGGATASISIAENTTAVTTVTATDTDVNDTMSYSITGGADQAAFDIASGVLVFTSAPDYENPIDAGGNNTYVVIVTASDGTHSDTQTITVTITDINDNMPVITAAQHFSIAENVVNTASVGTVTSTDGDANTTYSNWSIVSGNGDGVFGIDSDTGQITVEDTSDLDYETIQLYTLGITVRDGTNTSDAEDIDITVTDINDNTPTISSNGGGATASISIAENETAVTTVTATDADVNDTMSYSITGGADQAAFDIASGVVTFSSTPDYENPTDAGGNNTYVVIVTASDGANTDTQTITVTVTNVNDVAPIITSNGGTSGTAISVAENETAVTTVIATDTDGTVPTFFISGGTDAAHFTIVTSTGVLAFSSGPDYETPTDSNENNMYVVEVTATDGVNTDTQSITITITNMNDNAPVITNGGGNVTLAISVAEGMTVVTTTVATDADGTAPVFSISGGADQASFVMNTSTGELTFVSARDYELPTDNNEDNTYIVIVTASDGDTTATQTITVFITDENDTTPIITTEQRFSLLEDAIDTEHVGTVLATDGDADTTFSSWTIQSGNEAGIFALDADSGEITVLDATNLNYEVTTSYTLTLTVSDGIHTASGQTIVIDITDVDESLTTPTVVRGETSTSTIVFSWDDIERASLYTVSTTAGVTVTTTETSYLLSTLSPNTDYTIQVRAEDGLGNTSVFSIPTTAYTDPNPIAIDPPTITKNGQTSVVVEWNTVDNPVGTIYEIYNVTTGAVVAFASSSPHVVTGLSVGTIYQFKVRVQSAGDTSQYTEYSETSVSTSTAEAADVIPLVIQSGVGKVGFIFQTPAESHTVTLDTIDEGIATITLNSTPVTVSLGAGESENVDTNGNGIDETTVSVSNVGVTTASVVLSYISASQDYEGSPVFNTGSSSGGGGGSGVFPSLTAPQPVQHESPLIVRKRVEATPDDIQAVDLEFHVDDATQMAISNDPYFEHVSYEGYQSEKLNWQLDQNQETKTVYVKFRSQDGATIMYAYTISAKDGMEIEETPPAACALTTGQPYKTATKNGVYYITDSCTRRAFTSADVYFRYYASWNAVSVVSTAILENIPLDPVVMPYGVGYDLKNYDIIKTQQSNRVYTVFEGVRHWISTEQAFVRLGYTWNAIKTVSDAVFSRLINIGSVIR